MKQQTMVRAVTGDNKLVAVDLFAGAGGLSCGLREAGFDVRLAVENDREAARTYRLNHPHTRLINEDIRKVDGAGFKEICGGRVHLLAGCPPCQGFTPLTSKWRRDDDRNDLLLEMGRFAKEVLPDTVLIENVYGLKRRGSSRLEKLIADLETLKYEVNWDVLEAADFGLPQTRRRFVLIACKGVKPNLPIPVRSNNKLAGMKSWHTVREAIGGSGVCSTFQKGAIEDGSMLNQWHVTRNMSEVTLRRLDAAVPGKSWEEVPVSLRPACHRNGYVGFRNVYGRMEWDKAAPTITAGCTTLSKGRYGHPEERRTITVYEAALLQGFPSEYRLATQKIDRACSMIGNAFPPKFAAALAFAARDTLGL